MKMKFNKEILNLGLTEMKRIQVNSLSKNLVMDKRILWILFLVSSFTFAQTTVTLEDQCNCEVLQGTDVSAPGATTPGGADLGDLYVNTTSGTIFFWDGDSWELTTAANTDNQQLQNFTFDAATNVLTLDLENGGSVNVNLTDLQDTLADTNTTNDRIEVAGPNLVITDSENNIISIPLADIAAQVNTNTTITSFAIDGTNTNLVLTDSDSNSFSIALTDIAALVNTDSQNLENFQVNGANLELGISNGNTVNVPLADIVAGVDTDDQTLSEVLTEGADAGGTVITGLGTPVVGTDAATKTYVDTQVAAAADDDITGASLDAPSNVLTISEGATDVTVNLSDLDDTAAIAAVQSDVDGNEADADAAIALKEDAANKSTDGTLVDNSDTDFPTEQAVKTYVDTQVAAAADDDITGASLDAPSNVLTISEGATDVTVNLSDLDDTAAIAAVQSDVDGNEADADAAIAAVQSDVDGNEADADAAIALKEDAANKSTDGTLVDNSDTDFPTEQAVKTYVDTQVAAAADDDITGASLDAPSNVLTISEGATDVTVNLSDLDDTAAIAAVQADVDGNEADADAAIALKEDAANKSNDGTLVDNSATDFPTEQAVKTYVDAQVTASTTLNDGQVYVGNGSNVATGVTASGDATISNTGVIDLTNNAVETDEITDGAVTTAKIDGDAIDNTKLADDAVQLENIADGTADGQVIQWDAGTTSWTLVDLGSVTVTENDGVIGNEVTGATDGTLTLSGGATTVDPLTLGVTDGGISTTQLADGGVTLAKLADGTTDGQLLQWNAVSSSWVLIDASSLSDDDITGASLDAPSNVLTISEGATDVTVNLSDLDDTAAIAAVQSDVDGNEADADAAIALKEDAANKSTDGTLVDNSDTDFPTEQAVKTYVDTQVAAAADDDITGASLDAPSNVLTISEGATDVTVNLSDLDDTAAIAAVQSDVDGNEADADAAIAAVQSDVDGNEADADAAIALKEDAANKSTDGTLVDNSDTDFPTEQAVKTYVDTQVAAAADDDITGASLDAPSNVLTISEGATDVTVNLSDLDDTAAIAAVQADVDGNEADADAAIALKEDAANKSTDGTLVDNSDTDFPTEQAVKTYVDTQITANTSVVTAGNDISVTGVGSSGDPYVIANFRPNIFYPPSISIDVSAYSGTPILNETIDLHAQYIAQYGSPMVRSDVGGGDEAPATIPTYASGDLYYYVTFFDNTVFANVEVDANGEMEYDIIGAPADYNSLINVVFVVK